jgi:acyl-CoA reductase-like NAD-dependent aldehyde dehydrogenase
MSTIESGARPEDRRPADIETEYREIPVENPATGEVIRSVPNLGPDEVAEVARRGRAAPPAWEALGF